MKFFQIIASILILFLLSCSDQDKDILVVGTSADYPPFEFIREGEFTGFDIDVAKEIAAELNMKIKVVDMDFASLFPSLNNDQIDMAISSITITEERKKNIDFSDVYYQGYYGLLFKEGYSDYENFSNRKIGVQLGSVWEIMMNEKKSNFHDMNIYPLARLNTLVEELKIGRIDVIVLDGDQAYNYATNNDKLAYKTSNELGAGLAIAMKLNSPIKDKVNSALEKVKANKINALKEKWFKIK